MPIGRSQARVEITSSASKFGDGLRDARKKLGSFGNEMKGAFRSVGGAIGKVGGGLMGGLGLAGGFGAADVISDVMGVEKAMTRFQIAGSRTPAQMEAFRASLSGVAKASGISRGELVAGASAYVALTGDAEGAGQAVGLFAKVANATGASMEDISATAASMRDNLKIDPKDFEAAFSALHVQGKAGAVELRELATVMAGVAPQFSKFDGGSGTAGLAELGATLQVLRKDFGSTSEAATGARALFGSLVRGSGKLKKLGIKVFDANGEKRNFTQIIDEILAKDISEPVLQKILGSDEALRSIGALRTHRSLLTDITKASKDQGAIERDAATYRQSTAGKLAIAMEALKTKVADIFTPARIESWTNALVGAIEKAEQLANAVERSGKFLGSYAASNVESLGNVLGIYSDEEMKQRAANRALHERNERNAPAEQARIKAKAERDMKLGESLGMDLSPEAKTAMRDRNINWQEEVHRRDAARKNPVATPAAMPAPAPMSIYLQVDGNTMMTATANAKDQRRSLPGGK